MPDLVLQLTTNGTIRGTTTPDASAPVFSVYDFIDVVGRPPTRKRKRGSFSRDVWSRLTSPQSRFSADLHGLSVEAAIRASVKVRRSTPTPAMTVPALQKLLLCVTLDLRDSVRDTHGYVRHNAADTLARFVAGDHSMLEELQIRSDKRSAVKLAHGEDVVDSQIHMNTTKQTSLVNTDTRDLLLHLTHGTVVRGTTTPDASAQVVFSVYDFIDVVGNQLSRQRKCSKFSTRLWKRLTHKNVASRELVHTCVHASIRCNIKSQRRIITPAMTVLGLRRILELVYSESNKMEGQGLRQNRRRCPMDYETRNSIETIFEKIKTGDHTMIENYK
jgi:hypothetical protein